MNPFFSIAVTTYDRVDLLRQTLESILSQTYADFEILVGNDNQERKVHSCFPDINDPRVRWIDHPVNLGYVKNVNRLLELANGRFFTSISDDDLYFPNYLETMHRALTEFGPIQVAFCGFISSIEPPPKTPTMKHSIRIYESREWLLGYVSKQFPTVGCYGVFETGFIRSLGGTHALGSDRTFSPYNDNLFAIQAGFADKVAYCPESLLFYRYHEFSFSYISTDYNAYATAQKDFLIFADEVFTKPAHKESRKTYRTFLFSWFIRDFFKVMERSKSFSMKATINYILFIISNIYSVSDKRHTLTTLTSNILKFFPRFTAFIKVMVK